MPEHLIMWVFIILNLIVTVSLVEETRRIRRLIDILDKEIIKYRKGVANAD